MKRRILNVSLVLLVMFTMSSCSSITSQMKDGLKQIASSPMQVSDNVRAETPTAQFAPFGALGGALKGGFYMGKQIFEGLVTIVTAFKTGQN